MRHETIDEFYAMAYGETMILKSQNYIWLAWETEDGDWCACSPRYADDLDGPEGDIWRPVGPISVEYLQFPLEAVPALSVFEGG